MILRLESYKEAHLQSWDKAIKALRYKEFFKFDSFIRLTRADKLSA